MIFLLFGGLQISKFLNLGLVQFLGGTSMTELTMLSPAALNLYKQLSAFYFMPACVALVFFVLPLN